MGVGIGFILSAVIVFFSSPLKLTDEEVIARAAKLGMVKPVTDSGSTQRQESGTPVVQQPTIQSPASQAPDVQITITSEMGSEAIARMLEEKGVIKDRHEFLKVVTEHKAHTRFRNGTFTIRAGEEMAQIVKMLTGQ